MFNYGLNWNKIINENIPSFLRKTGRIQWIYAFIKPLKVVYADFLNICNFYINRVAYNSSEIYFEKILNDTFDAINRGIYITDASSFNSNFFYRKIEKRSPIYFYRKWDATVNYVAGNFAVDGNDVYKAINDNVNEQPSDNPADWGFYTKVTFFRRRIEFTDYRGFIVHIPIGLVYDDAQMNSMINYYRLAGVGYTITKY